MIDCFPFYNELDLLEIRLNTLAPYVRKFVLVESSLTHSGKKKPFYFEKNKKRFEGFNITHFISDVPYSDNAMVMDKRQREILSGAIFRANPEEIVLLSDLDEIPDLKTYNGEEGVFKQRLYYYYLDCYTGKRNWKGTVACRVKNISTMNDLRDRRWKMPIVGTGWHFSTLGPIGNIINKIESFAHQELNTDKVKENIVGNRERLQDPYNRNTDQFVIQMPSGPDYLLQNKEKYNHLFYEGR